MSSSYLLILTCLVVLVTPQDYSHCFTSSTDYSGVRPLQPGTSDLQQPVSNQEELVGSVNVLWSQYHRVTELIVCGSAPVTGVQAKIA